MKFFLVSILLYATIVTGCNSNTDLNRSRANDALFKATLSKELAAKPNSFTYKLNNYLVKEGKEYLNIDISRRDFKANISVLVNNWQKLGGVKQAKGIGYRGAELKGLKLALINNNEFEYKDLDRIVD